VCLLSAAVIVGVLILRSHSRDLAAEIIDSD
jgi:hypothetical protein